MPLVPVKPKWQSKHQEYTGAGRWILNKIGHECPNCGVIVIIEIPEKKLKAIGKLYGDEAYRHYKNNFLFTYSVVGVDERCVSKIDDKLADLKMSLSPEHSPNEWSFHMKILWSGKKRKEHPIFHSWPFDKVLYATSQIASILDDRDVFIYNIALSSQETAKWSNSILENFRNDAYMFLISEVINEITSLSAQPQLFFDSTKKSKTAYSVHGWARDLFRDSQYCLLYAFLSKGIEIPEPKFVKPASASGLELADFVSFLVARYYLRKWQGKFIELEPTDMGLVTYLGTDRRGDLVISRQRGYPWKTFND